MVKGSCFCKKVQFSIQGDIPPPWHCYCTYCRKLHGSAFATHTVIKKQCFAWTKGIEHVKPCESSAKNFRHFCGHCG